MRSLVKSSTPPDLWRAALVAVALPAAIAGLNYAQRPDLLPFSLTIGEIGFQLVWFIAQVGIVGYIVGRWVSRPVPRWLVFGWILLFIDVLAANSAIRAHSAESALLTAGLWAGQMGLCVVWAVFGDTHWALRVPAMVLAVAGLQFLWHSLGFTPSQQLWSELLVLQVLTLSVRLKSFMSVVT